MKFYDKLKAEIDDIQEEIVLAKNNELSNALDYVSILSPLSNEILRFRK